MMRPTTSRRDDAQDRGGARRGFFPGLNGIPPGLRWIAPFSYSHVITTPSAASFSRIFGERLLGVLRLLHGPLRARGVALRLNPRHALRLGLRRRALLRGQRTRLPRPPPRAPCFRSSNASSSPLSTLSSSPPAPASTAAARWTAAAVSAAARFAAAAFRRLRGPPLRQLALRLHALLLGHARRALAELFLVLRVESEPPARGASGRRGLSLRDWLRPLLGGVRRRRRSLRQFVLSRHSRHSRATTVFLPLPFFPLMPLPPPPTSLPGRHRLRRTPAAPSPGWRSCRSSSSPWGHSEGCRRSPARAFFSLSSPSAIGRSCRWRCRRQKIPASNERVAEAIRTSSWTSKFAENVTSRSLVSNAISVRSASSG